MNDSINNLTTNLNIAEHGREIQMVMQYSVIIIPIISLLLAYVLKYFLGKDTTKESIVYFILEFPVDLFFVGISVVTTLFFVSKEFVMFGLILLLLSLGIVAILCLLRQQCIKLYEMEHTPLKTFYGITIFNFSLSIFYIWGLLQFINL